MNRYKLLTTGCLLSIFLSGIAHPIEGSWQLVNITDQAASRFVSKVKFERASKVAAQIDLNYLNKPARVHTKGMWSHIKNELIVRYTQATVTGDFTTTEKETLRLAIGLNTKQTFLLVDVLSNYLILEDPVGGVRLSAVRLGYVDEQQKAPQLLGTSWEMTKNFQFSERIQISLNTQQTYADQHQLLAQVDVIIYQDDIAHPYRLKAKGVWHQEGHLMTQSYTNYQSNKPIEKLDQPLVEAIWESGKRTMIYNIYTAGDQLLLQNRRNLEIITLDQVN